MQLIVAIDADRRQADQLAALVRGRLAVELVQATSAGEALQALGERVPDLIMTSPLLSPFDDGVLAEYLRELGSAGAHVQTLRIPVLGVAKPNARGLFSFGRKRRVESAPDGCDPDYLADEIAVYLARAAEERNAAETSGAPAIDVSTDVESPHTTATYVPAYEPDSYIQQPANGYDTSFASETPVYVAPGPPAWADASDHSDEQSVEDENASGAYREVSDFAVQRDVPTGAEPEPLTVRDDGAADSEPETVLRPDELSAYGEREPIEAEGEPSQLEDLQQQSSAPLHEEKPGIDWVDADGRVVDPTVLAIDEPIVQIESANPVVEQKGVADSQPTPTGPPPEVLERSETVAAPDLTSSDPEPIAVHPASAHNDAKPAPIAAPAPRRTPSFEAALAAIRKAWGKPRRSASSSILRGADNDIEAPPAPIHTDEPPRTHAQEVVADQVEPPAVTEAQRAETKGALEIDLTHDIDALEPSVVETGPEPTVEIEPTDVDVYELSASPALHDLESELAAVPPPQVVAQVLPEVGPDLTPDAEPRRQTAKGKSKKARKNADKRQAPKVPKPNTRPVQDEWGLFDPSRCGFAAVVEKLNEVTDDEDPKANRTTVRVISHR